MAVKLQPRESRMCVIFTHPGFPAQSCFFGAITVVQSAHSSYPPLFQLCMLWSFLPLLMDSAFPFTWDDFPHFLSVLIPPVMLSNTQTPCALHTLLTPWAALTALRLLPHHTSYFMTMLPRAVCSNVGLVSGVPLCVYSLLGRNVFMPLNITYKARNVIGA